MCQKRLTRRTVLRHGAAVSGLAFVAGTATASTTSAASTDTYSRVDGTDYGGSAVGFDVVETDGTGGLIENVVAYDSPMIADLHTVVWDARWELGKNTRDDATAFDVRTDDAAPAATATVAFEYVNPDYALIEYTPELTQRAIASAARPALLVEQELELGRYSPDRFGGSPDLRHTMYAIANPIVGEEHTDGWVTDEGDYDVFVATDHEYSLAIVQRCLEPGVKTGFDGHRVGTVGVAQGEDRSAWADIYEEADGWIDHRDATEGDIDFGAGLSVDADQDDGDGSPVPTWRTGIGFGTSDTEAIENAIATVEDGYETERSRY